MQKHKFNIFPEMSADEYEKLKADLVVNGFDSSQPIVIYEKAILDGWNRFKACQEASIPFVERVFLGNSADALNFVMRTNKRRNLTSQQWAAIAVEADGVFEALREETERLRRERQAESRKETELKKQEKLSDKFLSDNLEASQKKVEEIEEVKELTYELDEPKKDEHANKTTTKLAQSFNTNRTYVQQAQKLKETAPEKLEEVKQGKTTFQEIKKEEKAKEESGLQKLAGKLTAEVEKEFPSETLPEKPTDDFTRLAAQYAQSFQKILAEFERMNNLAWQDFKRCGQDFRNFGKKLDLFGGDHLPQKMLDLKTEVELLKGLKICPKCKGKKCNRCKNTGYLPNHEYKDAKSEMEIN